MPKPLTRDEVLDLIEVRLLAVIREDLANIMANLDTINAALADLSAQITQLADQVSALTADTVTQAQLDEVATGISNAAAAVDAIIEPDPGETPVP